MNINAIKDAVKALAQSLQIASIFPATLLVFANVYIFLPYFFEFDTLAANTTTLSIAMTLLISYLLYAFNYPLIRIFEGYKFQDDPFFRWLTKSKRQNYSKHVSRIGELRNLRKRFTNTVLGFDPNDTSSSLWRPLELDEQEFWDSVNFQIANLEYHLDMNYPPKQMAILPTSLGNTIAASESYSGNRYGIDTVALWPRLIPIIRDTNYIEFVAQERTVLDFLLNCIVVVSIFSLELGVYFFEYRNMSGLAVLVLVTGLLIWVLYNAAIIAARQWGISIRVAFDLHRHMLRKKLGIRPSPTFSEEFDRWRLISSFFIYQQTGNVFEEFIPANEVNEG